MAYNQVFTINSTIGKGIEKGKSLERIGEDADTLEINHPETFSGRVN